MFVYILRRLSQTALVLAIHEALGVYGLNYVVDPKSSYAELSANGSAVMGWRLPAPRKIMAS